MPSSAADPPKLVYPPQIALVGPRAEQRLVVLGAGADGRVRVWEAESGRLLVTLWDGADGWLAVTPDGYFAAGDGLMEKAGWRAGGKPGADPGLADPKRVGTAAAGGKVPVPTLR